MSTSTLHLIDTCVLVNIRDIHKDSSKVWDALACQIDQDNLKSVRQVLDEVERRWPDIFEKLKPFKKKLLIPDGDLYAPDVIAEIREIQKHHPGLMDPLAGRNPADPFLIAAAKSKSAVVVTDEKSKGPRHKSKIPFVCTNRNVGWIDGNGYWKGLGCV
jgi:Domain of unknown function (DUF4411)